MMEIQIPKLGENQFRTRVHQQQIHQNKPSRAKQGAIKTSAAARYGLWHMHTVIFVKIGYKRGAEESRRTDQVTYRALGYRQSQK